MKWHKETPTVEGWYWMKYKNKHNKYIACPAQVTILKDATVVNSARNDTFIEGPNHGGKGLRYNGKLCPDIRFGDAIVMPTTRKKRKKGEPMTAGELINELAKYNPERGVYGYIRGEYGDYDNVPVELVGEMVGCDVVPDGSPIIYFLDNPPGVA